MTGTRANLSIAICTYNRSASLRHTLASLAQQQGMLEAVQSASLEILIVNNNCSDDTPRTVAAFADQLPFRMVVESRQGLAHARNRAIAEFRGTVLLFTDDDVTLEPGWLAAYQDAIERFPEAEFFGGRILPAWPSPRPRWVPDAPIDLLDGVLVWYDHGTETRAMTPNEVLPCGASFALRRSLVDEVGGFRGDLGVNGKRNGRGEETEFLNRARAAGKLGFYVGEALCWHAVDPRRLTLHAFYRYGLASGEAQLAMERVVERGSASKAAMFLIRGIFQLAKGRGDRFRQCVINAGMQMGTRRS